MNLGNILVVAPHPDDEMLGAGGTLLRTKAQGNDVHWLVMTSAHEPRWDADYIHTQERQVNAVKDALQPDSFQWWKLPASGLAREDRGKLIDRMRTLIATCRATTLILPHSGDAHDDHHIAHAVGVAAAKSFHMKELGIRRIMSMEILSETDAAPPVPERVFFPNIIIDISPYLDMKLHIISLYGSELSDTSPRNLKIIEAHARTNGASFGIQAAERFMLIRELQI